MSEEVKNNIGRETDAVVTGDKVFFQVIAIVIAFVVGALVLLVTGYSPIDA